MVKYHRVAIRMQQLDDLLKTKNEEGVDVRIAYFIRNETHRNTPTKYPVENYGESMIAMLKLLATLRDRFPLDFSSKGFPFFAREEFWSLYVSAMKQLVTETVDPAFEFEINNGLAEHLLE